MVTLNDTTKKEKTLAILAAITGHSIWGFSYLFSKMALQVSSPNILLSVRFTLAFIIVNIMLLTGKCKLSFKGKPIGQLVILGILEPVYFYFESYGILYTNATCAGLVLSAVPVAGLLMAAVFLKEYPTVRQIAFCFFPIVGVILITISGSELGIITPIGGILLLCTLLSSAGYRTMNRKTSQTYTSFERTYMIMAVASVVFTTVSLISLKGDITPYIDAFKHWDFVVPVLVLSSCCSVLCYSVVNYAAARMTVMTLSIYATITSIVSMFSGVIFLHEPMTLQSFAGALLVIFGIWQVTKSAAPTEGDRPHPSSKDVEQ